MKDDDFWSWRRAVPYIAAFLVMTTAMLWSLLREIDKKEAAAAYLESLESEVLRLRAEDGKLREEKKLHAEKLARERRIADKAWDRSWEEIDRAYECRRKLDILPSEELVQERYLWLEHLACDEFAYEGKFYDMQNELRQAWESADMSMDIVNQQRSEWYGMLIECECPLDTEDLGCEQIKSEYNVLLRQCGLCE